MKCVLHPKTIALFLGVVICSLSSHLQPLFAQTYTVESVPNNKVTANRLVSNPDHILSDQAESEINALLDSLERATSAQVAVVMLHSIGDASEFDFAQDLFHSWGIGQAKNDNGMLILFVEDKHIIRFHTGFGLEGILPDVICKRIQMDKMVPRFKEQDVDGGMIAGVQEVVRIISDPTYAEEVKTEVIPQPIEWKKEDWLGAGVILFIPWVLLFTITYFVKKNRGFANSPNGPGKERMHTLLSKGQWLFFYLIVPPILFFAASFWMDGLLFFLTIYIYFGLLVLGKYVLLQKQTSVFQDKGEFHSLHEFYTKCRAFWIWMAILFPLPFLLLVFPYLKRKNSFRTMPRKCKNCSQTLRLLDDRAEDEYLLKSMLFEEELKSVDYDVWLCDHCRHLAIEVYLNERTPYEPCPKCKTIAYYEKDRRTISEATTSSSGLREITKECKYCQHRKVSQETIPRIVESSSSSSSGSSSDSGGSFGGGDSGGGGASSSW